MKDYSPKNRSYRSNGNNSDRGSYSGRSNNSYGDRNSGGRGYDRDNKPKVSFDVVCDNCGKNTTVPFEPTSSKPVYCRDCFDKMNDNDGGERNNSRRPSFNDRPRNSSSNSSSNDGVEKQLKELNAKLDQVLDLLNK